jgi:hypothetical protein
LENEKDDENTSRLNNSLSLSSASWNIGGRFGKKKTRQTNNSTTDENNRKLEKMEVTSGSKKVAPLRGPALDKSY